MNAVSITKQAIFRRNYYVLSSVKMLATALMRIASSEVARSFESKLSRRVEIAATPAA